LMATLYRMRAAAYASRMNIEGAIVDLSVALQMDPPRPYPNLIERAKLQEKLGRLPEAREDFRRALEANPNSEEAKSALARLKG
jgi:tetratricopeptide (TPR) repeat protein